MAMRNIVKTGDDVLLKKARRVERFDRRLHALLDDMLETMRAANGVGLAGPQVGILRQIVVIEVEEGKPIELINPQIIEADGEQTGSEGCLSFPGVYGIVTRPNHVRVRAQDRNGEVFEAEGEALLARAFCHEIDHLDGILYVDKMVREIFPDEEEEDGEAETDGEEEGE